MPSSSCPDQLCGLGPVAQRCSVSASSSAKWGRSARLAKSRLTRRAPECPAQKELKLSPRSPLFPSPPRSRSLPREEGRHLNPRQPVTPVRRRRSPASASRLVISTPLVLLSVGESVRRVLPESSTRSLLHKPVSFLPVPAEPRSPHPEAGGRRKSRLRSRGTPRPPGTQPGKAGA